MDFEWKCKKCGSCCLQGPCMIDRNLKDAIPFKFVKDEIYFGRYRPLMNSKGVCRYLRKNADKTYSCPIIEQNEIFRKHMNSGKCAFRKD